VERGSGPNDLAAGQVLHAGDRAPKLNPTHGPAKVKLGSIAELDLPESTLFFGQKDTRTVLEKMGNITDGSELGLVYPQAEGEDWFVVFEFNESGYIKDAAKEKIDADALLKSIEEGNEQANVERKKRGESALHVTGWAEPPHYDPQTQNLTWATFYQTDDGHKGLNYNVRLLGRTGVMSVTLVDSPDKLAASKPNVDKVLAAYGFARGQRYSEWRSGDKVAQYGLAALVAGGAAAAGAKLGLFAVLGKLLAKAGKAIVFIFVAIAGGLAKFWNALRGKFTARKKGPDRSTFPDQGRGPGQGGAV
jgi:uncharacterized membrane-anchored protein